MTTLFKRILEQRVKQDKDIKDKDGSQPAKYHSGLSKDTKQKRDAHFKAKKSGPAPGDAEGKTKKSVHTKKYEKMFGKEVSEMSHRFVFDKAAKLDKAEKLAQKFKLKADSETQGNYYYLAVDDGGNTNNFIKWLKATDSLHESIEELEEETVIVEKIEGLVNKSKKSGISYGILKKVYDRGLAAYKTGHRPGTTAPQWAFARVNSFITKGSGTWGKADKDLANKVRGESFVADEDFTMDEACWDGYKQVGTKKKGGKVVPNCVPEETEIEENAKVKAMLSKMKGVSSAQAQLIAQIPIPVLTQISQALGQLVMGEDTVEEDRDYKKEYENYQGKPDQIKRRAARNAARNQLKDNKDIKGKDVHHKDNNPMNNDKSNLSVVSKNYNRKEPRLRERLVKQGILKNGKRK